MSEDLTIMRKARKRQVSWDRAEKARIALTPYFQELLENDLRFALTDFLIDVLHLADMQGLSLDRETFGTIVERSFGLHAEEEAPQRIREIDKVGT